MTLIDLRDRVPDGRCSAAWSRRVALWVTLGLLLALAIFTYLNFQTVVVEGRSMEPTFHSGERVLVTRAFWLFGPLMRDDVVVIREVRGPHETFLIKRVAALPGERVPAALAPGRVSFVVPSGYVFVLGDNLAESDDSRHFGVVLESQVLGKVVQW